MCVVALKYFNSLGWVGVKNRDRNYKPIIHIKQSFRRGLERLYLLDEKTKYTEGLNEFGVCILSAALATKKDEKEGTTKVRERENFSSPDGKKIRTALFEKTVEKALDKLIESELPGNTIVFDKENAFLLEGAKDRKNIYKSKVLEIPKDEIIVRTNHGVLIPWSGYQGKDNFESRKSSETRKAQAEKDLSQIKDYKQMLDCISNTESDNPQLNPLRLDSRRKALTTTGQIMLVPNELTLHYRPIWCNIHFDFDKLNSKKSKTYFQVLSSREIMKQGFQVAKYLSR